MVSIIEVKTKKQLRCFVDYPNQLYRDVEQFVPATYGDDLEDWDRSKNPAFAYCDARCWLAYRDGEVVGRIGAILSRKANEKWGTNAKEFYTQMLTRDIPITWIDRSLRHQVMFGSNNPRFEQIRMTQAIRELGFRESTLELIMGGNARMLRDYGSTAGNPTGHLKAMLTGTTAIL